MLPIGFTVVAHAAIVCAGCVDTKAVTISMPTLPMAANGSYEGEYKLGPVTAKVSVVLSSGRISSFQIVKHECLLGRPAEALAAR